MEPSTAGFTVTDVSPTLALVEFAGRVDAVSVGPQRERLRGLLAEGRHHIVVSLANVNFLDSAGMAMLVSLMKQARLAGGDVSIVRPEDESVRRILHLTRLDLVLSMQDSVEAAMERFTA